MPKSSSKQRWGEWSEWTWDPSQGFHYCVRQDAEGNLDYLYQYPDDEKPRTAGGEDVENITEGMSRLSHSSDSTGSPEYKVHASRTSSSSGKTRSSGSSKGKEKRQRGYEDKKGSRDIRREIPEEEEESYPTTFGGGGGYHTSDASYMPQDQYTSGSSSRQGYDAIDPRYNTPSATRDPTYTANPNYYAGYDPSAGQSSGTYIDTYDQGDDDGRATPKPVSSTNTTQMAGHMLDALDPRYRIERSDRFQPGEIFKISWAEPKGNSNEKHNSISGKDELVDAYGVTFVTGFRRFIVIANDQGHSTCVPILSYGSKACTKRGVKAEKHGIVYQRGHRPKLLDGEPELGFPPVRVDITMEGEKISKESRVNYSKLVTVEHNFKVMFIGTIAASDWPLVPDAINKCWDQKDHHGKRRSRK